MLRKVCLCSVLVAIAHIAGPEVAFGIGAMVWSAAKTYQVFRIWSYRHVRKQLNAARTDVTNAAAIGKAASVVGVKAGIGWVASGLSLAITILTYFGIVVVVICLAVRFGPRLFNVAAERYNRLADVIVGARPRVGPAVCRVVAAMGGMVVEKRLTIPTSPCFWIVTFIVWGALIIISAVWAGG
jgi:hypothetical protein